MFCSKIQLYFSKGYLNIFVYLKFGEDLNLYLKEKNKFECAYSDETILIAAITFPQDKHNEFFQTLAGVKITSFEESPFTLQDYFMSFYKEERDFGGLSGVKGNSKAGLNKEVKK